MRQEQPCQVVCRQKLVAEYAKNFKEKIDDEYRVNMYDKCSLIFLLQFSPTMLMFLHHHKKINFDHSNKLCRILDNLPVAVLRQRRDGSQSTTYEHGFRVGFKGNYAGVSAITGLI